MTTAISATALSTLPCNIATPVPGRCGVPGCAYVIASNLGPAALCTENYCNCGGHVAPLLTQTVSDTTSLGCAYTTVPTCNDCTATTCPGLPSTAPSATFSSIDFSSSSPTIVPGQPVCPGSSAGGNRIDRDMVAQAVALYCALKAHSNNPPSWVGYRNFPNDDAIHTYERTQELRLQVDVSPEYCGPEHMDLGPTQPGVDLDACKANLMTTVDGCPPFIKECDDGSNDCPFLKYGGWNYQDCYKWTIETIPTSD